MKKNHSNYLELAFNLAKQNLGKTKSNPSVGCVIVKNNSVISSGLTQLNGRPHAESIAINKTKNCKNTDLYVTLEPCTHYGKTPPCTNLIIKKGIKRVYYSFEDVDKRTKNKSKKILSNKKIKVLKIKKKKYKDFYQSYFLIHEDKIPYIDAKIASSKDFFTINKKNRWITNELSRKRAHLIRSQYDSILSTSETINKDNALLNCRLNGLNSNKPDLIIVDLNLKIKKNLRIFDNSKNRKIYLVTKKKNNNKIKFLKKKGIRLVYVKFLNSKEDFMKMFNILKKKGYNRILIESGLVLLKELIKFNLIYNLFFFQSSFKLKHNGKNNTSNNFLKKLKLSNKIKVNLKGDSIYRINLKNYV